MWRFALAADGLSMQVIREQVSLQVTCAIVLRTAQGVSLDKGNEFIVLVFS